VLYYRKETNMKLTALVCAAVFSVVCFAASPTIGVVATSSTAGETSLIDGSALKTENTASDVRLDNGVAVHFAPRSAGTVFTDHTVLEQGAARVSNFASYPIEAGKLSVQSETPGTEAVIRLENRTIEIASLGGALKVTDGGAMLTRVEAGTKMSFQNSGATPGQSGASPAPRKPRSETKTWLWVIGGISAAALAIGLTAAAQGKSPF
jgi:hypothetical protein